MRSEPRPRARDAVETDTPAASATSIKRGRYLSSEGMGSDYAAGAASVGRSRFLISGPESALADAERGLDRAALVHRRAGFPDLVERAGFRERAPRVDAAGENGAEKKLSIAPSSRDAGRRAAFPSTRAGRGPSGRAARIPRPIPSKAVEGRDISTPPVVLDRTGGEVRRGGRAVERSGGRVCERAGRPSGAGAVRRSRPSGRRRGAGGSAKRRRARTGPTSP